MLQNYYIIIYEMKSLKVLRAILHGLLEQLMPIIFIMFNKNVSVELSD